MSQEEVGCFESMDHSCFFLVCILCNLEMSSMAYSVIRYNSAYFSREVTIGQLYQYQVQAIAGAAISEASPPLFHIHGSSYCGDGQVSR